MRRRLAKAHNNVAASSVVALKLLGFHSAALPARRLNPNFVLYCAYVLWTTLTLDSECGLQWQVAQWQAK